MAAIYAYFTASKIFYTSKPYPIVARDSISEVLAVPDANMVQWVPVTWSEDITPSGITLTIVISYSFPELGMDTWECDIDCIQATLQQSINYVELAQGPETWSCDMDVLSSTLTHVIGYIFITQPPDEVEEDFTITGCTLVDV